MKLKVVLKAIDHGGFKAYVPELPGCTGKGMDEEETLNNVRDAVLQYFGIEDLTHTFHEYSSMAQSVG